jgi:hypothetical protein
VAEFRGGKRMAREHIRRMERESPVSKLSHRVGRAV